MNKILKFWKRARVVLSSIVTWLLVAQAILLAIVDQVAPLIPAPWGEQVTAVVMSILGIVAVAIAVIRQVTRVTPDKRGLIPPG